jgi:hypothetical protein
MYEEDFHFRGSLATTHHILTKGKGFQNAPCSRLTQIMARPAPRWSLSGVNSWGKTMSGSEQMFLVLTIGAFALFGVVLAYVDITTASIRDRRRG